MLYALLTRLWNDEAGSIVATEYLLLGTIVGLGSVTGLATVRDSINDEYQEFGTSVREVRQSYSVPAKKGGGGSAGGTTVTDGARHPLATPNVPPTLTGQQVQFSMPTP